MPLEANFASAANPRYQSLTVSLKTRRITKRRIWKYCHLKGGDCPGTMQWEKKNHIALLSLIPSSSLWYNCSLLYFPICIHRCKSCSVKPCRCQGGLICDLGTRWGWVVSVTLRLQFTPGTHCAGPRAGLDTDARAVVPKTGERCWASGGARVFCMRGHIYLNEIWMQDNIRILEGTLSGWNV
jgi:hypothetical protein